MKDIYMTNSKKSIHILNNAEETKYIITPENIKRTRELKGFAQLEFDTDIDISDGDRIIFLDLDGEWNEFIIQDVDVIHNEDGITYHVYCEDSTVELVNVSYPARTYENCTPRAALSKTIGATRFMEGVVDEGDKLTFSLNETNAKDALLSIADAYNMEVQLKVDVYDENKVAGRYINLVKNVGNFNGKRFVYKKDLISVKKRIDKSQLATRLTPHGAFVKKEGVAGDGLDRVDINGLYGSYYIEDENARLKYGLGPERKHIDASIIYDDVYNPMELVIRARRELEKRAKPKITYELDVIDLYKINFMAHEKVGIGDVVIVNDLEINEVIKTRVIKIEDDPINFKTDAKITLGDVEHNWENNRLVEKHSPSKTNSKTNAEIKNINESQKEIDKRLKLTDEKLKLNDERLKLNDEKQIENEKKHEQIIKNQKQIETVLKKIKELENNTGGNDFEITGENSFWLMNGKYHKSKYVSYSFGIVKRPDGTQDIEGEGKSKYADKYRERVSFYVGDPDDVISVNIDNIINYTINRNLTFPANMQFGRLMVSKDNNYFTAKVKGEDIFINTGVRFRDDVYMEKTLSANNILFYDEVFTAYEKNTTYNDGNSYEAIKTPRDSYVKAFYYHTHNCFCLELFEKDLKNDTRDFIYYPTEDIKENETLINDRFMKRTASFIFDLERGEIFVKRSYDEPFRLIASYNHPLEMRRPKDFPNDIPDRAGFTIDEGDGIERIAKNLSDLREADNNSEVLGYLP